MTPNPTTPDTIVLIHGLWMTPLSWEHWGDRYTSRGYKVLAPAWPGMDGDIEQLRRDPSGIAELGVTEIVDHYDAIIRDLDQPPIIMGHSFGGLFTQVLLDRGLGAAGVAIDSAPVKGILVLPFSTLKVAFPVLRNPANLHRTMALSPEQFHYAFANTISREDSDKVYERYHIPASGRLVWVGATANFSPGHQENYVDFKNEDRAPLLFIGGSEDNIMPPAVNQSNAKHYRHAKSPTDYKEFEGRSHYSVIGGEGWEEVADYALDWAVEHAKRPAA